MQQKIIKIPVAALVFGIFLLTHCRQEEKISPPAPVLYIQMLQDSALKEQIQSLEWMRCFVEKGLRDEHWRMWKYHNDRYFALKQQIDSIYQKEFLAKPPVMICDTAFINIDAYAPVNHTHKGSGQQNNNYGEGSQTIINK